MTRPQTDEEHPAMPLRPAALSLMLFAIAGCSNGPAGSATAPPISNPGPTAKLADVNVDNEGKNMDRIRKRYPKEEE
jgi:hypothetical protein